MTHCPLSQRGRCHSPVFFSPNASPQSATFKCWIVCRATVFPTITQRPTCDRFQSFGRTHLTQVEPRRRLCVFVPPFVSCEVTLMGSQRTAPPLTSPSSVMTPFRSILSLKTDKAPPVTLFSTLLPSQCGWKFEVLQQFSQLACLFCLRAADRNTVRFLLLSMCRKKRERERQREKKPQHAAE